MLRSFLKAHNVPTSNEVHRTYSHDATHELDTLPQQMLMLSTTDPAMVYRHASAVDGPNKLDNGDLLRAASIQGGDILKIASLPSNMHENNAEINNRTNISFMMNNVSGNNTLKTVSPNSFMSDGSSHGMVTKQISENIQSPLSANSPDGEISLSTSMTPENAFSPKRAASMTGAASASDSLGSPTRALSGDFRRSDTGVGKKQRPKRFNNAVASNFCHICCRSSKRVRNVICRNIEVGTCRKVICAKCFAAFGWNWTEASAANSRWVCTHCEGICPARSQCGIYNRTNSKRKTQKPRPGAFPQ